MKKTQSLKVGAIKKGNVEMIVDRCYKLQQLKNQIQEQEEMFNTQLNSLRGELTNIPQEQKTRQLLVIEAIVGEMGKYKIQGNFDMNRGPTVFSGNRDYGENDAHSVLRFLSQVEVMGSHRGFYDHGLVEYAADYLDGEALRWWYGELKNISGPLSWESFQEMFKTRFFSDAFRIGCELDLMKMKIFQKGNVDQYVREFRNCLDVIGRDNHHDNFLMRVFIRGLKEKIRLGVAAGRTKTLDDAISWALKSARLLEMDERTTKEQNGKK